MLRIRAATARPLGGGRHAPCGGGGGWSVVVADYEEGEWEENAHLPRSRPSPLALSPRRCLLSAAAAVLLLAPLLLILRRRRGDGDAPPIPTVAELRRAAASASVDLLLQTSSDPKVDVGALCDVVDASIDAVGVRGLLREVFETHTFRAETVAVARSRGVLPGLSTTFKDHHMTVYYEGLINEPATGGNHAQCTGCLWWLRHYVGAAIADRMLRDGSLSLDGRRGGDGEDSRVDSPRAFLMELQELQRLPDADFVTVESEHAFVWHTLAATRPGLPGGYPTDLLVDWCGDYVDAGIWQDRLDTDLGTECRHSFGHGVFYAIMRGLEGGTVEEHYSARIQFRPFMTDTPKELKARMLKICDDALPPLNWVTLGECRNGIRHSIDLLQKTNPPILLKFSGRLEGPVNGFVTVEMFKAQKKVPWAEKNVAALKAEDVPKNGRDIAAAGRSASP